MKTRRKSRRLPSKAADAEPAPSTADTEPVPSVADVEPVPSMADAEGAPDEDMPEFSQDLKNSSVNDLLFSSINLVSQLDKLGIQSIFVASLMDTDVPIFTSASVVGHAFIKMYNLKDTFKNYCESYEDNILNGNVYESAPILTEAVAPAALASTTPASAVDDVPVASDLVLDAAIKREIDSEDDAAGDADAGHVEADDSYSDQQVKVVFEVDKKPPDQRYKSKRQYVTRSGRKSSCFVVAKTDTDAMSDESIDFTIDPTNVVNNAGLVNETSTMKTESEMAVDEIDQSHDELMNTIDASKSDTLEGDTSKPYALRGTPIETPLPKQEDEEVKPKKRGCRTPMSYYMCSNCNREMKYHFLLNGVLCTGAVDESYKCNICGDEPKNLILFKRHFLSYHQDVKPWICCFCHNSYLYSTDLRAHMNKEHTCLKPYKCDKCGKSFALSRSLRLHAGSHNDPEISGVCCEKCGKKFGSTLQLQQHGVFTQYNCGLKYVCSECHEIFSQARSLKSHMETHDIGIQEYICDKCDITFEQFESFYRHVITDHEPWQSWYCTECKENFPDGTVFSFHRCKAEIKLQDKLNVPVDPPKPKNSKDKQLLCCETCGKICVGVAHLKRHRETHLTSKDYHCMECGRSYFTRDKLKKHVKCCHSPFYFPCETCGKAFNNKQRMYNHVKVMHSVETSFQCSVCGKTLKSRSSLKTHMMIHSDERPHPCQVCNQRFRLKAHLVSHMMKHTGEKPYGCGLCGKRYTTLESLNIHIDSRAHKGLRPYTCEYCHNSFSKKWYMQVHMKRKICIPRNLE